MDRVAVLVPTLRRPEGLAAALGSLMAQEQVEGRLSEIVVVDNDRQPSSRSVVDGFREASVPVVYVHEPRSGVASARNAGLTQEVMALQGGTEAVEKNARENLGLIKEGEVYYQFVEEPEAP